MKLLALFIHILIVLMFSGMVLWSCSEDDKSTEPDTTAPVINITYPANNAEFTAGAVIVVKAEATDNESISKVDFFINGSLVNSDTNSPYEYSLNTDGIIGNHTISAKAYDSSDNTGSSTIINVKIKGLNHAPVVNGISAVPATIEAGGTSTLTCTATDADGDILTYLWKKTGGIITGTGRIVTWTAPGTAGSYSITCTVSDSEAADTDSLFVTVIEQTGNHLPVINSLTVDSLSIYPNNSTQINCSANDADGDEITYAWNASIGILTGSGSSVNWTAPGVTATCYIDCTVDDGIDSVTARRSIYVSDGTISAGMIFVQGGSFDMGDHFNEGRTNELPVHSVIVSDLYIGKFEVTQSEWAQYMPVKTYSYGSGVNYPVYQVNLYETLAYCNRRSIAERLTPCYSINGLTNPDEWGDPPSISNAVWDAVICNWSAGGYRLPTEAEWEYSARGGINWIKNYRYSGSDDIDIVAWYMLNNSPYGAQPVGTKAHNQLGIHDMTGNISEWCWDWYGNNYYKTCSDIGIVTNPRGPVSGDYRVLRGGFWYVLDWNCRIAFRDFNFMYYSNYNFGFRLARKP